MDNKTNKLIVQLKYLVRTERKITAEIIEIIKEIDRLRLYLDYGHTSMFSFLTKEIGYTPAAAQRRIDAARLSMEIPKLKEDLKSGVINLSQVSMMAQAVRQKQKEQPEVKVTTSMKKDLLEQIQSKDLIQTEKALAQSLDLSIQVYEKKHHQKDSSVRLELTLSEEQMMQLERVKELSSHQNPNPSMAELIDFLAKSYLKAKDPLMQKKRAAVDVNKEASICNDEAVGIGEGLGADKASVTTEINIDSVPVALSRQKEVEAKVKFQAKRNHIPIKVKQEIFQKDQCCQWWDLRTDQICGSRFQLQIDHKEALWKGGNSDKENLQVLCAVHNKLKYQKEINA